MNSESGKVRDGTSVFFAPFTVFENPRRWRFRQCGLQPIETPIAGDVGRVLGREMKASFWQPSGPLLCDPAVLRHLR